MNKYLSSIRSLRMFGITLVISSCCFSSKIATASESFETACQTIVENPKVKGATQEECECVLNVYGSSVDTALLLGSIEYFKEPTHKVRSKIEWDLSMSMPPHAYRKTLDSVNKLSIEQCGTDMRIVKSKGNAGIKTNTANKAQSNKITNENKVDTTQTIAQTSNKSTIVTEYDWPDWWGRKKKTTSSENQLSKDYSHLQEPTAFCGEISKFGKKEGTPVPEGETCLCVAKKFVTSFPEGKRHFAVALMFGTLEDRTTVATMIAKEGENSQFAKVLNVIHRDIEAACDWSFNRR